MTWIYDDLGLKQFNYTYLFNSYGIKCKSDNVRASFQIQITSLFMYEQFVNEIREMCPNESTSARP